MAVDTGYQEDDYGFDKTKNVYPEESVYGQYNVGPVEPAFTIPGNEESGPVTFGPNYHRSIPSSYGSGGSTANTEYGDYAPYAAKTKKRTTTTKTPFSYTVKGGKTALSTTINRPQEITDLKYKKEHTPVGTYAYTRSVAPEGPIPELGAAPDFDAPEYDEREVRKRTQLKASPQTRRLKQAVQTAMARPYENPNVKAMSLRSALSGYGEGLQSIMAGSSARARAEYGEEYQTQYQSEIMDYQTARQREMAEFSASWQNYMQQYQKESVSQSIFERGGELVLGSGEAVPSTA